MSSSYSNASQSLLLPPELNNNDTQSQYATPTGADFNVPVPRSQTAATVIIEEEEIINESQNSTFDENYNPLYRGIDEAVNGTCRPFNNSFTGFGQLQMPPHCCTSFQSTLKRVENKLEANQSMLKEILGRLSPHNNLNVNQIAPLSPTYSNAPSLTSSERHVFIHTRKGPIFDKSDEGSDEGSPPSSSSPLLVRKKPRPPTCKLFKQSQQLAKNHSGASVGKENTWILRKLVRPRVPSSKLDQTIVISDISSDEDFPVEIPTQLVPHAKKKLNVKRKLTFIQGQAPAKTIKTPTKTTKIQNKSPKKQRSRRPSFWLSDMDQGIDEPSLPKKKKRVKGSKLLDCPECLMKFEGPCKLNRHIIFHNKIDRPFPCFICANMHFTSKGGRSTHMRYSHPGESPPDTNTVNPMDAASSSNTENIEVAGTEATQPITSTHQNVTSLPISVLQMSLPSGTPML